MQETESREDYLEMILILRDRMEHVRSIDIVNAMSFSKPSVSIAMKKLKDNGMIEVDGNGYITLTDAGERVAKYIYERHVVLTKAITLLGVDEEIAKKDACKIEHDLSDETFEKIKKHLAEHGAR